MEPFEIFAQAISIVAMAIGVLSFQQKTQKGIVLMQFCSSILFAIHYGMIGGLIACMLNSVGIIRAAVFSQRDKRTWAAHISWVYVFSAAFIAISSSCSRHCVALHSPTGSLPHLITLYRFSPLSV